jgi:transposase
LLLAADGLANTEIGLRCNTTREAVRRWRQRFELEGVATVGVIAPGRGRRSDIDPEIVDAVVSDTLTRTPDDGSTHWSTRTMAQRHGVGKDTVARIWRAREIKPWLIKTFKLSKDPDFEKKLIDVVGLYLDPPERAVVLGVDEKSQCQALERSQPSLPMTKGRAGTMTHDYKGHGTTTLFAALNAATGEVLYDCRDRHRHQEFLSFLKLIDVHVPKDLDVHVVADNYATHEHPEVQKWLSHPKRERFHMHFTPTSSSWLNLVERWFRELADKRLRRDSFGSVRALIEAIQTWTEHWNHDPKAFV